MMTFNLRIGLLCAVIGFLTWLTPALINGREPWDIAFPWYLLGAGTAGFLGGALYQNRMSAAALTVGLWTGQVLFIPFSKNADSWPVGVVTTLIFGAIISLPVFIVVAFIKNVIRSLKKSGP